MRIVESLHGQPPARPACPPPSPLPPPPLSAKNRLANLQKYLQNLLSNKKFWGRFFLIERRHFLRTSADNCCKYINRIEPNLIFHDFKLTVNNHAPGMAKEKFKYSQLKRPTRSISGWYWLANFWSQNFSGEICTVNHTVFLVSLTSLISSPFFLLLMQTRSKL